MTRRRIPWAAALFSVHTPGLGQLYAGHPVRGAGWLAGSVAVIWGSLSAILVGPPPGLLLLPFVLLVGFPLAAAFDAWRLARRSGPDYRIRAYNRWYLYLGVLAVSTWSGSLAQSNMRSGWVEAFRIPSGSMEPTLMIGDFLYVDKRPGPLREITRGELVVFRSVEEAGVRVIKRVEGLPGDTLEMRGGMLYRNGLAVSEAYVHHTNPEKTEEAVYRSKMRTWQVAHLTVPPSEAYQPDLNAWGPVVVPPDSFFALGDNRDQSYDSRYYGFIPFRSLLGRPVQIYYSYDVESRNALPILTAVRWGRIGLRP